MYKLKQIPSDFIVKEIFDHQETKGKYYYFLLTKENRNTLDVIKEIARKLNLKTKDIGFSGTKDKVAITSQVISIPFKRDQAKNLEIINAKLEYLHQSNKPLSLGDHQKNQFTITIRNLEDKPINQLINQFKYLENYFDEQRFSKNNVKIAKAFLTKDFKLAAKLIDQRQVQEHLKQVPTDFIGAIKKAPMRLLRLLVNSYQSYIFNTTLSQYLTNNHKNQIIKQDKYSQGTLTFINDKQIEQIKDLTIPLIGFSKTLSDNQEINTIATNILKQDNLTNKNFIIKQIPQITLEGELKQAFIEIENLIIQESQPDELNENKKKIKVTFTLPKSSYATMAIRKLIK